MNRYKPVGWRSESHRHYLAAKGIKTKHKYFSYRGFLYEDKKYGVILNDRERELWVQNNSDLYSDWKDSGLSMSEFIRTHKDMIDNYIKKEINAEPQKYFAMKEEGPLEDDRPFYKEHKLKSEGTDLRLRDNAKMKEMVLSELDKAVETGELYPEKREEFLTGEFKTLQEQYVNRTLSKSQFDDETRRSLDYFKKVNNRKLRVFFWADKKKPEVQ